jgi:ATP-binding cassette, subfamily B, bacterial HlyB/CyaB
MLNQTVDTAAFFWALQGICALHRKPFSMELATQQLAAPPYRPLPDPGRRRLRF